MGGIRPTKRGSSKFANAFSLPGGGRFFPTAVVHTPARSSSATVIILMTRGRTAPLPMVATRSVALPHWLHSGVRIVRRCAHVTCRTLRPPHVKVGTL